METTLTFKGGPLDGVQIGFGSDEPKPDVIYVGSVWCDRSPYSSGPPEQRYKHRSCSFEISYDNPTPPVGTKGKYTRKGDTFGDYVPIGR